MVGSDEAARAEPLGVHALRFGACAAPGAGGRLRRLRHALPPSDTLAGRGNVRVVSPRGAEAGILTTTR
jgi:hypothetical protein